MHIPDIATRLGLYPAVLCSADKEEILNCASVARIERNRGARSLRSLLGNFENRTHPAWFPLIIVTNTRQYISQNFGMRPLWTRVFRVLPSWLRRWAIHGECTLERSRAHAAGISSFGFEATPQACLSASRVLPNYCSHPPQPISPALPSLLFICPSVCRLISLLLSCARLTPWYWSQCFPQILLVLSNLRCFSIPKNKYGRNALLVISFTIKIIW